MSSYLFDKYRKEKCGNCLRVEKCSQDEHDIIFCSYSSYYKGPGDEVFLSYEERQELGIETKET